MVLKFSAQILWVSLHWTNGFQCVWLSAVCCNNKSLECSAFVDDSYPGWKQAESMALCKTYDGEEVYSSDDEEVYTMMMRLMLNEKAIMVLQN